MLLQSLKLKNIRSYTDQTISFSENSTLLSGDIGSGKSTLLLALEFALFGLSKPDLTGETLLRKGAATGSVELTFQLPQKTVTIQRNLKKAKDAINQTAGYLIANNLKKELTPVELRSEIIRLLHYPEETISKTKNYLFRYTVYCPQAEMKLILQESPDFRLDLLRKIFNLDKYQKIREALDFYLKELRTRRLVLKTKLEPLEQKKSQLNELQQKQEQLSLSLQLILPNLTRLKEEIRLQKQHLAELEQKNHLRLDLQNQLSALQKLLQEKQSQHQLLSQRLALLSQNLSSLFIPETKEKLQEGLLLLQKDFSQLLSRRSGLTLKISHCQEKVFLLQKEIPLLVEQASSLEKKEEEAKKLEEELKEKEKTVSQKETAEQALEQLKHFLHQHQLFLSQAREIKEKLPQLEQCPTCLQTVPPEHKKHILQEQLPKIADLEKKLQEVETQKSLLQKQFLEASQQLDSLFKKESLLARLQAELALLKEKPLLLRQKKEALQELVKENNSLVQSLEQLKPEEASRLEHQISQKQELLQKLVQKQEWEKNQLELSRNLQETFSHIEKLSQEKNLLEHQLSALPDLAPSINRQQEILEELSEKEKSLLAEKTRLATQKESLQEQLSSLLEEIRRFTQLQSHLTRLEEISYWLEEFFAKLTHTIEKHMLIQIHHLFDGLFQDWFAILIEDENFSARLDDSFTPLIEQNGYEISFDNLSGGEKTAASLAYRLALNKVINDLTREIQTKDLLILDEPTDGFSSEQLDKVRDVLEKLNLKQTILVSHESKIESFVEHVLRISKVDGVSRAV